MRGLAKGEPNLKILVLSDSHRCVGAMYDAAMLEKPDVIFHLGDHVSDAQELSYALDPIDFYEVRGNCDFGAQAPETILTELAGVRFFLTHGHLFGVKSNLTRLKLEANRVGAQVALFGHTHRALCEQDGGVWYLNPGAAKNDCYGVVEVRDGKIHCTLKTLSDENNCLSAVREEPYAFSN